MTAKASGAAWIAGGLAVDTALALVDLALGSEVTLIGVLVVGPLIASMSARIRGTAAVAVYGVAIAAALGPLNGMGASADHVGRGLGVIAGGALAVWVARLMFEREQSVQRLAIQEAVAQVLAQSSTLAEAAPAMLRTLGETFRWTTAAIWRVEPDDVLRRVDVWSAPGSAVAAFQQSGRERAFMRGIGLPGRVWASGEPAWITDVQLDGNFPRAEAAALSGLHTALGVPVVSAVGTVGVIEFFAVDVRDPNPELIELMMNLGQQLGERIERARAVEEAAVRGVRNRAILESALDAVIAMDHRSRVIEFNPAAETMFGRTREEALGNDMAELIIPPSLRAAHRAGLRRYLTTGVGSALGSRVELVGMRADGSEFPVELAITRVGTLDPPTFTGYIRDISERKWAEKQLTQSRTLLAQTEDVAQTGGWEWDVLSGEFVCSAGLYKVLDLPVDAPPTLKSVVGALHPDDQDRFARAIQAARRGQVPFALECRAVRRDGSLRVLRTTGQAAVDDQREPVKLVGAAQDITDQVEARAERELLAYVVDCSDDAILTKSPDGVITSWNRGAERLYGHTAAEAVGRPLDLIIPSDRKSEQLELLGRVFAGEAIDQLETQRVRRDGSHVTVSLNISPVKDVHGTIVSASVIARDVTDRKHYEDRLRHLADHDPLTDLLNRRGFEQTLALELTRAERYDSRGAVLCLDVDDFKSVNDSGGHAAGDELIVSIGVALGHRLRATDAAARLGGDEFAILLPETDSGQARIAAQKLLDVVRNCSAMLDGNAVHVTGSIGIALFATPISPADEVLVHADLAMYEAKSRGGDRAVAYAAADGH